MKQLYPLMFLACSACTTTHEHEGKSSSAHSHLKCTGYCDLTIKESDIDGNRITTLTPSEVKAENVTITTGELPDETE